MSSSTRNANALRSIEHFVVTKPKWDAGRKSSFRLMQHQHLKMQCLPCKLFGFVQLFFYQAVWPRETSEYTLCVDAQNR